MFAILAPLALISATGTDAAGIAAMEQKFRPVTTKSRIGLGGTIVSMESNAVASTEVRMEPAKTPYLDAYAEYMSVGPLGAAVPDTARRPPGQFHLAMGFVHSLRVTISSSERNVTLTIDDLLTGRADTRVVNAEYRINPYFDPRVRDLWAALQRAPRVLGPDPTGPPIVWLSPTSFQWITRSDTLVLEQRADAVFKMMIRARVR